MAAMVDTSKSSSDSGLARQARAPLARASRARLSSPAPLSTITGVAGLLGGENRGEMVLVIAGADAKRTVTDTPVAFDGDTLPPWALRYLDAAREGGMTLREAVKPLARHLGVAASELYRMAVAAR